MTHGFLINLIMGGFVNVINSNCNFDHTTNKPVVYPYKRQPTILYLPTRKRFEGFKEFDSLMKCVYDEHIEYCSRNNITNEIQDY